MVFSIIIGVSAYAVRKGVYMIGCTITKPGKVEMKNFEKGSLTEIQEFVGGYIETLNYLGDQVVVVVHDEGKLVGLPHTCFIRYNNRTMELVGNVVIFKIKNNDFSSITQKEAAQFIGKYIF